MQGIKEVTQAKAAAGGDLVINFGIKVFHTVLHNGVVTVTVAAPQTIADGGRGKGDAFIDNKVADGIEDQDVTKVIASLTNMTRTFEPVLTRRVRITPRLPASQAHA